MPTLSISLCKFIRQGFCRDRLGDVNRCESMIDFAIVVENLRESTWIYVNEFKNLVQLSWAFRVLVESAKYALVGCAENALDVQKLQWLSVQKMHWMCRFCSGWVCRVCTGWSWMWLSLWGLREFSTQEKLLRVWGLCELSECSKVRANFSTSSPCKGWTQTDPSWLRPLLSREDVLHEISLYMWPCGKSRPSQARLVLGSLV